MRVPKTFKKAISEQEDDADGSTTCAFGPGVQRALLEAEGVPFTEEGRVDFSRCRWDGT